MTENELNRETSTTTTENWPCFGADLRAAREAAGITMEELAGRVRVRHEYLQALEDERFDDIPGDLFAMGYLRMYANETGLDPDLVITRFRQLRTVRIDAPETGGGGDMISPKLFAPRQIRRSWVAVAVGAVFLVAMAWWFRGEITDGRIDRSIDAAVLRPHTAPRLPAHVEDPAKGAARPSRPTGRSVTLADEADAADALTPEQPTRELRVRASEMVWLAVTVDDGDPEEYLLRAGEQKTLRGRDFALRIGNAGGAELFLDGKPLGTLGPAGKVITLDIPHDLAGTADAPETR